MTWNDLDIFSCFKDTRTAKSSVAGLSSTLLGGQFSQFSNDTASRCHLLWIEPKSSIALTLAIEHTSKSRGADSVWHSCFSLHISLNSNISTTFQNHSACSETCSVGPSELVQNILPRCFCSGTNMRSEEVFQYLAISSCWRNSEGCTCLDVLMMRTLEE